MCLVTKLAIRSGIVISLNIEWFQLPTLKFCECGGRGICCIADYQAVGLGYLVTALQRQTNCTVILA